MHAQISETLRQYLKTQVIGQEQLIDYLLIALLCDGHILVEGPPGLAKTRAVKALADVVEGEFHRVQFTPDLLPADLTGTDIYRPEDGSFTFEKGPLFHNLILADEINRAPAKVQSALLEAMAERQITVGRKTYPLPPLFLVMATQNPIEQEGTFPLPEAQLDRFMLHLQIDYPSSDTERAILALVNGETKTAPTAPPSLLTQKMLFEAQQAVLDVHMAPELEQYLIDLIIATRQPGKLSPELASWVAFGVSPRATIALSRASRAMAWLDGRDFVTPDDIRLCAYPVLRHRLLLSYEAEAQGICANDVIDKLLELVALS